MTMVDLGKYAVPVIGSYVASLALLAALVGLTVWQGARMVRALRQAEAEAEAETAAQATETDHAH